MIKKAKQAKDVQESIEYVAKQEKQLDIPEERTFVAKEDHKALAEKLDREVAESRAGIPEVRPAVSLAPLPGPVPAPVYVPAQVKSRHDG